MTVGSLFAGIGGFDLGFSRAGFEISWQVEKDEWCQKVLAKHFPLAKRIGDIRNAGKENLSPVDVICGGFPCQPFSSAGKQGGTEDDRYLWPEMLRVISELRPTWVVAENVLGLVTGKMEPVFEQVLLDLEGEGYDVQAFIIPACGVDAPHRRYRVWIVAHTEGERFRETGQHSQRSKKRSTGTGATPPNMGNTNGKGLEAWEREPGSGRSIGEPTGSGSDVADSECSTGQQRRETRRVGRQGKSIPWHRARAWEAERKFRGIPNGVSARMDRYRKDRLRGLGNAIVPDIAELFGHIIMEIEHQQTRIAA